MEAGIKSGKIHGDASSSTVKKPFSGKREVNASYGQINHGKVDVV